MDWRYFKAISILVGTMVGVGIFGLPYVFARSSFLVGVIYLVVLTAVTLFVNLAYGETILRTKGNHQFVGYVARYFGPAWRKWTVLLVLANMYGVMLVYILEGGRLLQMIFGSWWGEDTLIYGLVFFIAMGAIVCLKIKRLIKIEMAMVFVMATAVFLLLLLGVGHFNINYLTSRAPADTFSLFAPYAVVLFTLSGSVAVRDMKMALGRDLMKLKSSIIWGTLIAAGLTFLFTLVVVAVAGPTVDVDAVGSLGRVLGQPALLIGAVFGFLAVATSFVPSGGVMRETFVWDLKMKEGLAILLTVSVPLILYLLGLQNFIVIISFLGAVAGGFWSVVTILIYLEAKKKGERKPEFALSTPRILIYLVLGMFVIGAIWEIVKLF